MTIRPLGAELFHAEVQTDEQTDMTNLTVAFRNFANPHKKKNGIKLREINLLPEILQRGNIFKHGHDKCYQFI
jgi:hypothetical protein